MLTAQELDQAVVSTLSSSLDVNNSWMRTYKSVLLDIAQSVDRDNVGIEFAQVSRRTHGPVVGDAPPPSGKEIAALIFKDDPTTRSKICLYIPQNRSWRYLRPPLICTTVVTNIFVIAVSVIALSW